MANKGSKALSAEIARQSKAGAGQGSMMFNLPAMFSAVDRAKKSKGGGSSPVVEPPLPPVTPQPVQPEDWEDIVGFYFPKKSGMADGGLVRGGGQAQRGRGRGKMV